MYENHLDDRWIVPDVLASQAVTEYFNDLAFYPKANIKR